MPRAVALSFAGARAGCYERGLDFARQVIALGVRGESVGDDIVAVLREGGGEEGRAVGVLTREFCGRREGEVEEIVKDEDLPVAIGASADADGGNAGLCGDGGGEFARNRSEEHTSELQSL